MTTATADAADATPLWQAIEELRQQRGWSMAELGRRSDIKPSSIFKWRKQRASAESVRKLAAGFGLATHETRDLLVAAGHIRPDELGPPPRTFSDVEEAIRNDPVFNEQQQTALIAAARAFYDENKGQL